MSFRYLVIAPQLGFNPDGSILPGGLLSFGRCVVRALAQCTKISRLGIWCQTDRPGIEKYISHMLGNYSHARLKLNIRCFGGNEIALSTSIMVVSLTHQYDRVMYLLVNQSVLGLLPWHLPYEVWEIGEELFNPISWIKLRSLNNASRLLSISNNTSEIASIHNNINNKAKVAHLCVEPDLYSSKKLDDDPIPQREYDPCKRKKAILIVANLHQRLLYKGHQELILGWDQILEKIPDAQLWIVGDGDGRSILEELICKQSRVAQDAIKLIGRVNNSDLSNLFEQARVFAMPSSGEGFGLVFVEAMRYGLPCIGGKEDSVKEIIINGETGLLVDKTPEAVAQACIQLLSDDTLASQLGANGQQRYLSYFQFHHFQERLMHALELDC